MHGTISLCKINLAVLPFLRRILTSSTVPKSSTTRSRSRSIAHSYIPDESPPDLPDLPRPVISTKYKTTTTSRSPQPSTSPALRRIQTDTAVLPPRPTTNGSRKRKIMRVEFAFDAESETELSIAVGEMVAVLEEVDAGWFIGEIVGEESRQGMFPATYCTVVETNPRRGPLKPPSPNKAELEEQV